MTTSEKRLQEAESLSTSLTFHQGGEGSSLIRSCVAILKSLLECTSNVEFNETDVSTTSLGLSNLLLLLDRDESQLRTLALPTSLAILNRVATSRLITDDSSISRLVKLIHGLSSGSLTNSSTASLQGLNGDKATLTGYPQSVLRSGILSSICRFADSGLLQVEDKGLVMETVLLCIEEVRTREDAALVLSLAHRFFETIKSTYPDFVCVTENKNDVKVTIQKSPSSSPLMLEHSCRCVARLLSILSRLAEGHWKHWKSGYNFDQRIVDPTTRSNTTLFSSHVTVQSDISEAITSASQDIDGKKHVESSQTESEHNDDEEDEEEEEEEDREDNDDNGDNYEILTRQKLVHTNNAYTGTPIPANWALQSIAHLWKMGTPNLISRALAGHCAISAPGTQDSFIIEGSGFGLTRYTIRALLRSLARTLMVLCEHQRLLEFKPTISFSSLNIPVYSIEVQNLLENFGIGGILLRIMSISAGKDLSGGKETLHALNGGHVRDPETIEDCLLLLASLLPRTSTEIE